MEVSLVAVIKQEIMEDELIKDSSVYHYFLHSITRKCRMVMLQMAALVFNDSLGGLAEILLRLASQEGKK